MVAVKNRIYSPVHQFLGGDAMSYRVAVFLEYGCPYFNVLYFTFGMTPGNSDVVILKSFSLYCFQHSECSFGPAYE